MGKLAYRPLGAVLGMLAGLVAGAAFKGAWRVVAHDEDAPQATDAPRGWVEIVLAAMLEGAVFGAVKAVVDRAGAAGFAKVTGTWPD